MSKEFFVYDPVDDEFTTYTNEDDARRYAQKVLDACCDDCWDENTDRMRWGRMETVQQAVLSKTFTREEYAKHIGVDIEDGLDCDYYEEWELRDVAETAEQEGT